MSHLRSAVLVLITVGSTELRSQESRELLPGWNASFTIPSGWRLLQRSGRAAAMSDSQEVAAVFVTAAFLTTPSDATGELRAMFADLHYAASPTSLPVDTTIAGRRAQVAYYRGAGRAGTVVARSIAVFTAHGTGLTVLGFAPERDSVAVTATVLRVAASIQAAPPTTHTALVTALAGHWKYVPPASAAGDSTAAGSAAIDESLEFDGRERFTLHSRTVVSVRVPGVAPLVSERANDAGTYTVVGSTLVLRGASGPRALEVQLNGDRLSLGGRMFQRTPS